MGVTEIPTPLRDHFRPPVSKKSSWEGFHAMWPTCIVQQLRKQLPPGFVAEPRVHLGTLMKIDLGALESSDAPQAGTSNGNGNGRTAICVETEPPDEYEYEVRIFDVERERRLVAAIETDFDVEPWTGRQSKPVTGACSRCQPFGRCRSEHGSDLRGLRTWLAIHHCCPAAFPSSSRASHLLEQMGTA